jgi:hypothetical protein
VTKAGPLDDASNVIEEVDGIQIVDRPKSGFQNFANTSAARPSSEPRMMRSRS